MPDAILDFDTIHAEFRPKILRYLSGLVGPDEAEDLCQVVFVKVHSGLSGFRGEASPGTWIYRIATSAAIDRLRTGSFGKSADNTSISDPPIDVSYQTEAAPPVDGTTEPSAETALIRNEMNECIQAFVDTLSEPYRLVVVLSHLEGLRNREIAEILGVSIDTVKIRLHRARRELRKRFEAGCDFYRTEANELACDRKTPGCQTKS